METRKTVSRVLWLRHTVKDYKQKITLRRVYYSNANNQHCLTAIATLDGIEQLVAIEEKSATPSKAIPVAQYTYPFSYPADIIFTHFKVIFTDSRDGALEYVKKNGLQNKDLVFPNENPRVQIRFGLRELGALCTPETVGPSEKDSVKSELYVFRSCDANGRDITKYPPPVLVEEEHYIKGKHYIKEKVDHGYGKMIAGVAAVGLFAGLAVAAKYSGVCDIDVTKGFTL